MLELAIMAQSVNMMQEATTEVGVIDGSARDEVHLIYYCVVRFMFMGIILGDVVVYLHSCYYTC